MIAAWICTLGAVASLVGAWWYPSTELCVLLGWTSALLWTIALIAPVARLRRMYIGGVLTYCGGFYWLFTTISDFGGFPFFAALAVFLLFAFGSAFQFLIWGFVWQHLPATAGRWGLRLPLSWLVAHRFWIKIFPWDFGHTQIAFTPFAQLASIGGVTLITFVMLWVAEVVATIRGLRVRACVAAGAVLSTAIILGARQISTLNEDVRPTLKTVLVQGNISLEHKHNVSYFTVNRERYDDLSRSVSERDLLIVWPESTITQPIPAQATDARFIKILPHLGDGSAFLVGAITYASRTELFNSSVLIRPDASIDTPYNKIILMPFGEYTPFSTWLPWLKEINSTAGEFTAGVAPGIVSFTTSSGIEVKASPLICYEDLIPSLARAAVAQGATLLVNQTNDAWFGNTVAPYQHHMIASFRAIENRRYLLRSTNTGLTAVVDPVGRTLAALPPYVEAVLPAEVQLLGGMTWYTRLPVEYLWLTLSALTVLAALADIRRAQTWCPGGLRAADRDKKTV